MDASVVVELPAADSMRPIMASLCWLRGANFAERFGFSRTCVRDRRSGCGGEPEDLSVLRSEHEPFRP